MVNNEYVSDTKVFDSYGKGWNLTLSAFWTFLGIILISMLVGIPGNLSNISGSKEAILTLIAIVWGVFVSNPIGMSTAWVFLKAARKEDYQISDMFAVFKRNYWNSVGASILSGLAIMAGLILFIIPGIIVALRLSFVSYFIIDDQLSATQAMRASWELTKGYSWTILGIGLIGILVMLAGLLVLGVGVFFSFIWLSATSAVLYYSISLVEGNAIAKK